MELKVPGLNSGSESRVFHEQVFSLAQLTNSL
jgi:hypothetical protein